MCARQFDFDQFNHLGLLRGVLHEGEASGGDRQDVAPLHIAREGNKVRRAIIGIVSPELRVQISDLTEFIIPFANETNQIVFPNVTAQFAPRSLT